jgi:hypothetical protein
MTISQWSASFTSSEAYYSEIISRVASRFGVVKGLVLDVDGEGALVEQVQMHNRPLLQLSDHEGWRTWVEKDLSVACMAIVDTSVDSESVQWELKTARKYLGDDRVLAVDANALLTAVHTSTDSNGNLERLREELEPKIVSALTYAGLFSHSTYDYSRSSKPQVGGWF